MEHPIDKFELKTKILTAIESAKTFLLDALNFDGKEYMNQIFTKLDEFKIQVEKKFEDSEFMNKIKEFADKLTTNPKQNIAMASFLPITPESGAWRVFGIVAFVYVIGKVRGGSMSGVSFKPVGTGPKGKMKGIWQGTKQSFGKAFEGIKSTIGPILKKIADKKTLNMLLTGVQGVSVFFLLWLTKDFFAGVNYEDLKPIEDIGRFRGFFGRDLGLEYLISYPGDMIEHGADNIGKILKYVALLGGFGIYGAQKLKK